MALSIEKVDVLVCGGGPAGLLTAYALLRTGISSCVIEKEYKAELPMYGRACTLYPRSCELLDSYELLHDMSQSAFIARNSVTYKDGKRVTSRGWHGMFTQMHGTFCDYVLSLRLKYSEELFQQRYEKEGGQYAAGWEVTNIQFDTEAKDDYKVSTQVKNNRTGVERVLKSKFIVGADGGRSTVRELAGIDMPRTETSLYYVRIDAVIETDMPDADIGVGSIESPKHGNVLFIRLDRGRTRLGIALNPTLYKKYGRDMTQEQVVFECQEAMKPFKCEFKKIDWYTVYRIHQGVASEFVKNGCVALVGDAGHTHSSGMAQGMNTGIHDTANLAWKLAGVLKGQFKAEILDTYNSERRAVAQHLIALDMKFAALIAGEIPKEYQDAEGKAAIDPNVIFTSVLKETLQFTIGLGISYPENLVNMNPKAGMLEMGHRAPDQLLYAPGARIPMRLHQLMRYNGKFNILVFAGETLQTHPQVLTFRKYLDRSSDSILKLFSPSLFRFITILVGNSPEPEIKLGCERFGDLWFDRDHGCHTAYGVAPSTGAVMVLRPDGYVGFATRLDQGVDLVDYFGAFMTTSTAGNGGKSEI